MRELMDSRESTLADPAFASLWDRALGLWASHASWFGLHGHLWMGPLAAVQMQSDLRRKFASNASYSLSSDVRDPLVARASAVYSIGQRMQSFTQKFRQFSLTVELATQASERDPDSRDGALLVRGHASLRIAQMGLLWRCWDAVADFNKALEQRERTAAPV